MNELKFGHRVKTNRGNKGRYIRFNGYSYEILKDDGEIYNSDNCRLDPEAEEFLIGDEVEFSDNGDDWVGGVYHGKVVRPCPHWSEDNAYRYCRYPQEEKNEGEIIEYKGKKYRVTEIL